MKKIVLTGAAGNLGSRLRESLSKLADVLVSTDQVDDLGKLYPGETYQKADLAKLEDMMPLMEGADMVVHFGAFVDEAPFDTIVGPNIIGSYNVWQSALTHGVRRVVYASSIHAVGMHAKSDFIGADAPHRPDSFYGLAKCFSEDLARLYWEKCGVEAVCLRILSCANVTNARAVGSWLSYDDMIQLVERSVTAPTTGFTIAYGVSDNDRATVDNSAATFLGYRPKNNAEKYAAEFIDGAEPFDSSDPANMCQGGPFAAVALGESGIAHLNLKPASDDS